MSMLHEELTSKIIKAFYNVYNQLGYGFLERVYENAMMIELDELGLLMKQQEPIKVIYKEQMVGDYFADIVVENKVIVELKSADAISNKHEAQLLNYLKATDMEVGLILNFGTKPQMARKIFNNVLK